MTFPRKISNISNALEMRTFDLLKISWVWWYLNYFSCILHTWATVSFISVLIVKNNINYIVLITKNLHSFNPFRHLKEELELNIICHPPDFRLNNVNVVASKIVSALCVCVWSQIQTRHSGVLYTLFVFHVICLAKG